MRADAGDDCIDRWPPGSHVVWRCRPGGDVGYVYAAIVLEDSREVGVLLQPTGAPCKRRLGDRGGARGRQMLPGGWRGEHEDRPWTGAPSVRVHPVGSGFAVLREWDEGHARFRGWYVNLERSWRRTAIGFDTLDDVLDVTVADDLSAWAWKDEDELAWAVEAGTTTRADADRARAAGEAAITTIERLAWPFIEDAWTRWTPPAGAAAPTLPVGWDDPEH